MILFSLCYFMAEQIINSDLAWLFIALTFHQLTSNKSSDVCFFLTVMQAVGSLDFAFG